MAGNSFTNWRREHPDQVLLVVFSTFTLATSIWLGWQANLVRAGMGASTASWRRAADQFETARQQFHVPTSSESADLLRESANLGALGVPASERINLMELVSRLADAAALRNVRVNFRPGGGDSVYLPPRVIGTTSINAAAYSVSVEFTGSFVGLVKFVSSLPPSVSVSRMGAARRSGGASYHLLLGVYEVTIGGGTT